MFGKICKFGFTLVLLVCVMQLHAQGPENGDKIDQAIQLMDEGNFDQSEALLREVISVDATSYRAMYELAFLQYQKKDYAQALKTGLKAAKMPGASDLAYQLAGNSADYMGNPKKAIALYREGLEKFPNSGSLYLELGNMAFSGSKYLDALSYYEQGIGIAPTFASNYRNATHIFQNSSELVWGLIYGELFINIEPSGGRMQEMSRRLYDMYNAAVIIGQEDGKRSVEFKLTENNKVYGWKDSVHVPFPMIYQLVFSNALPEDATRMDLETINCLRGKFLAEYFAASGADYCKSYPNILFDYQHRVAQAGHLEAYNYWVFRYGDEKAFEAWRNAHKTQWSKFREWFEENKLIVDKDHCFHRTQYDNVIMQ